MGCWITSLSPTIQGDKPNTNIILNNQLYFNKGRIYLIPRNTLTDNYTIPLGINKSKYDTRPSWLHDIGCKYHQVIIVELPLEVVYEKYLIFKLDKILCKDIPSEYLRIEPISFKDNNNLFYSSMRDTGNIPSNIYRLYYLGVNLNIGWLFSGKECINKYKIYSNILYTK